MPHHVKPMLATLVDEPFDRAGWSFEVKWDGYRAVAETRRRGAELYSRNLLSFESRFPPIVKALRELKHDMVLDGEVVVLDAEGRSRFEMLQNYARSGKGDLRYYVFDLLFLDGRNLCEEPLDERRSLLARVVGGQPKICRSESIDEKGIEFFQAAVKLGLEGIIAKNHESLYKPGLRSREWLKIKARRRQEAIIVGYTEPKGSRDHFGALVLGVHEHGALTFIGHTGSGFSTVDLAELKQRMKPFEQSRCPFKQRPSVNAPVQWVQPRLVCEVAFQEWTIDGRMRQPIFLGLREDKPARDVKRELPRAIRTV